MKLRVTGKQYSEWKQKRESAIEKEGIIRNEDYGAMFKVNVVKDWGIGSNYGSGLLLPVQKRKDIV